MPGEQYLYDIHGNTAHAHHSTELCPVCERIIGQSSSNGKINYPDGRYICGHCNMNENPVNDRILLKQAFDNAKELLQEKGFDFPKVTVHFASKEDFFRMGYHNGTLGLTTSVIGIGQTTHKITILYGLPMLLSSGILGHELLHVWQNNNGIRVDPYICEGVCELGSGLIYKRSDTVLGKLLFDKLERNMLKTYSDGFIAMKNMLETYGWQAVREYVKQNSKLY